MTLQSRQLSIRVESLKKRVKSNEHYIDEIEEFGDDWSASLLEDLEFQEENTGVGQRAKQELIDHHDMQMNKFLLKTARCTCGTVKVQRGRVRFEHVRSMARCSFGHLQSVQEGYYEYCD